MTKNSDFLRLHTLYERRALRILLKAFRQIGKDIPFDVLTSDNAETVILLAANQADLGKALFKAHLSIGKSYGNLESRRYRREIKKFKPLPLFNEAFQAFLLGYHRNFGGENIVLLTKTYVATVVSEIVAGTDENETVVQMRDRIYKTVNSPNFYRWQALRIARTETTFAMNSAKQISGEVSGLTMEKVWITAVDGREREAHRAMSGTAVGQDETFNVGGEKMQYPGDRLNGASGGNLINCRCSFGYRAKRDAEGNLMWGDEPTNVNSNYETKLSQHPGLKEYCEENNIKLDESFLNLFDDNVKIKLTRNVGEGSACFYDENRVNIATKIKAGKEKIIYHEFGHALDHNYNLWLDDSVDGLMKKYKNKWKSDGYKELMKLDEEWKKENAIITKRIFNQEAIGDDKENVSAFADTLMSLHQGAGAGHDRSYFKDKRNRNAEFIAHAFENKYIGNPYFKKVAPDLYDDMINLVESLIIKYKL